MNLFNLGLLLCLFAATAANSNTHRSNPRHGAPSSGIPAYKLRATKLQALVDRMWREDRRRVDVRPNFQGHVNDKTRDGKPYNAPGKFFELASSVIASLRSQAVYQKYEALMNNYIHQTGRAEDSPTNKAEQREENHFLDEVLRSAPMEEVYKTLHRDHHVFASSPATWKRWVKQLWFGLYSRARGVADTSGFEHVFIGEIKNGEVSGLHNWYQLLALEQQGKLDYKGFVVKRKSNIENRIASLKFELGGKYTKNSGSVLIGTSPAFDMALYTLCFLTHRGRDTCNFKLDGCEVRVTSYAISQASRGSGRGSEKDFIGSIFPSAGRSCR